MYSHLDSLLVFSPMKRSLAAQNFQEKRLAIDCWNFLMQSQAEVEVRC